MKNILLFSVLACALSLLTFGCSQSSQEACYNPGELSRWMKKNGKIKVLATTAMIADIASEIGGEQVDVIALITGGLDPHAYQLVKGDDEKLRFADIIFANGLELEHGPSLKAALTNNKKSIPLGDKIKESHPGAILTVDGQSDPHMWMDISLFAKIVPFIVEQLQAQDPAHASLYAERGQEVYKKLMEGHARVQAKLEEVPPQKRYLVSSHDAFHYFARAYLALPEELQDGAWRVRCDAPEGLAPESLLSTQHIQHIIDHLATYKIEVIFPESNLNQDSIKKILSAAKEKGLNVHIAKETLYGDAMGCKGTEGDTYLKMIEHNAHVISENLKK